VQRLLCEQLVSLSFALLLSDSTARFSAIVGTNGNSSVCPLILRTLAQQSGYTYVLDKTARSSA